LLNLRFCECKDTTILKTDKIFFCFIEKEKGEGDFFFIAYQCFFLL
jgi:hypothetical protein